MNQPFQDQRITSNVEQVSPETQGTSTIALLLETIFGLFGFLGVGHIYTRRVGLGIALMIGWWIFIVIAVTLSILTTGFAACLFVPVQITIPIISGIQARTYVLKKRGTGSWQSVIAVAGGGGCLIIVIVVVVLMLSVIAGTNWFDFGF